MTVEQSIVVSTHGHVRVIRLNRPDRLNALDPSSIMQFRDRLIEFREDRHARVAIITGSGTKGFCTGADLRETLPSEKPFAVSVFAPDEESIAGGNYIRGLDLGRLDIGKPLIAAVNGYAFGGGMEIAMACDIRIASETASFALPEVKVGSIPAVGGIQRLIRFIPHSAAMMMILTGETIDAATAFRIGLISEVIAPDKLCTRAMEIAERIARNAPLAVQAAHLLAIKGIDMSIRDGLLLEQFAWGTLRNTEDRIEGRKAFAEKRDPIFQGK